MGTLKQISALVVGEMWGLRFCSTERRLETIDCSLDRWQYGGGEKEEIFSNPSFFVYQTDHQEDRQKFIRICRHKQL